MINVLTRMSENLNIMGESLKRLHQSSSTAADEAASAQIAKPSTMYTLSESDSSDSEDLLANRGEPGTKTAQTNQIRFILQETERTDEAVAQNSGGLHCKSSASKT